MIMKKVFAAIMKSPAVSDVWSEGEDGYWIMLNCGWCSPANDGAHAVHEWTIEKLLKSFKQVKPCACKDCEIAARRKHYNL
jgi:hypothetical protein